MGFRVFSSVGPLLIAPFAAAVLATTFSRDTEAQTAAPAPLNAQPLPYAEPPLAHPVPQQMRLSFHDPWTKYVAKSRMPTPSRSASPASTDKTSPVSPWLQPS